MRIWVFARRSWAREADRLAEDLREQGHDVSRANSRWYDGELYEADRIYHDGGNQALVEVHEAEGIECEYVDYALGRGEDGADTSTEDRPAYRMEYAAPWYTIYDRDGNKVGKSTRSKEKAETRLLDLNAGGD